MLVRSPPAAEFLCFRVRALHCTARLPDESSGSVSWCIDLEEQAEKEATPVHTDTHRLPGHADNLNVMEVLASADEAMPALAARLAGADPASAASSASAVTSQISAPGDLAGGMHEAIARNLGIGILAAAVLHTRQRLLLQRMHPSVFLFKMCTLGKSCRQRQVQLQSSAMQGCMTLHLGKPVKLPVRLQALRDGIHPQRLCQSPQQPSPCQPGRSKRLQRQQRRLNLWWTHASAPPSQTSLDLSPCRQVASSPRRNLT